MARRRPSCRFRLLPLRHVVIKIPEPGDAVNGIGRYPQKLGDGHELLEAVRHEYAGEVVSEFEAVRVSDGDRDDPLERGAKLHPFGIPSDLERQRLVTQKPGQLRHGEYIFRRQNSLRRLARGHFPSDVRARQNDDLRIGQLRPDHLAHGHHRTVFEPFGGADDRLPRKDRSEFGGNASNIFRRHHDHHDVFRRQRFGELRCHRDVGRYRRNLSGNFCSPQTTGSLRPVPPFASIGRPAHFGKIEMQASSPSSLLR